MEIEMYDAAYQIDLLHWWSGARREIVVDLADSHLSSPSGNKIIDFGCGTGTVLDALSPYGAGTGIEFSSLALDNVKKLFPRQNGNCVNLRQYRTKQAKTARI